MNTTKKFRTKQKPVDSEVYKSWKLKMYDTSYGQISEATGLHTNTIANAIRTGKGTQATIDALNNYFNNFKIPA